MLRCVEDMSRRKQSNPKPWKVDSPGNTPKVTSEEDGWTKGEGEEWGIETEAMQGEPRTPSSGERASSGGSPASRASPASPAGSPPRLRLNTSLATDPARAPRAAALKREPASPEPPPPPPPPVSTAAAAAPRDYLAFTAFVSATAAAAAAAAASVPPYPCKHCGIRYSSLSTLQAHQDHYCAKRNKPDSPPDAAADAAGDDSSDSKTPRPAKKQYACTYCSYSNDKKVSLNRHMRMHSSSPASTGTTPAPAPLSNGEAEGAVSQDRYCTDCDIRFSSIKTFLGHKAHYCNTRQVVKPGGGGGGARSATSGSTPPSPGATPPAPAQNQYAFALPTDPILIVPYSIYRNAIPGVTLPDPDTPCFLVNGTFQPLSSAISAKASDGKDSEVLKVANRPRETATPLDLSVRRTPESVTTDDHEKENRIRSASPEQIVCAPSLPGSPVTPSPSRRSSSPTGETSPKRRRRDSRGPTPKPPSVPSPPEEKFNPSVTPFLQPGLALRLSDMSMAGLSPQVVVKQGEAKCVECNIVFCKYENYVIHKRQYCQSGGGEKGSSPAPPEPGPLPRFRQLICLACGIHFGSLDNLATHQSFYCTKRDTRSLRSASIEARPAAAPERWRCPMCEVTSPTAAAAQRHLETHAGVKAFRCTICQYRGNTLRGMRTHIRIHFPKKPADLQEENYIMCVVEEDTRDTTSVSPASGGDVIHRCTSCSYTSTYKGNVVRHAQQVHAEPKQEPETTPPPVPEIKKEPETEPEEDRLTYCKPCNIYFKHLNTYKAHKKFYCKESTEEAGANNNVLVPPQRVTDTPVL